MKGIKKGISLAIVLATMTSCSISAFAQPTPTATVDPLTLYPELVAYQKAGTNPYECAELLIAPKNKVVVRDQKGLGWVYYSFSDTKVYGKPFNASPAVSFYKGTGDCTEFALLVAFCAEDNGYEPNILGMTSEKKDDKGNPLETHIIYIFEQNGLWGFMTMHGNVNNPTLAVIEPNFKDKLELVSNFKKTYPSSVGRNYETFYEISLADLQPDWRTTSDYVIIPPTHPFTP